MSNSNFKSFFKWVEFVIKKSISKNQFHILLIFVEETICIQIYYEN